MFTMEAGRELRDLVLLHVLDGEGASQEETGDVVDKAQKAAVLFHVLGWEEEEMRVVATFY